MRKIEKYNSAVNTFRNKYGGIPGDLQASLASQFGFVSRSGAGGQGDGNGILQGHIESYGEDPVFWVDLSTAGLIDGEFNTASESVNPGSDITGTNIALYFPPAKIGGGNYVYVWAGSSAMNGPETTTGVNYFGVAAVTDIAASTNAGKLSGTRVTIPVVQAYSIDKKVDDGLPVTGNVTTVFLNNDPLWNATTDTLTSNPPRPQPPHALTMAM